MKNVKPNILVLAVLLLLWGCKRGPELTPITQEGKNTFSCKVNGKVWIPNGRGSIFVIIPTISGGFFRNVITDSVEIWIKTYKDNGEEIHLFLNSVELGRRNLNEKTSPKGASLAPLSYALFGDSKGKEYITSNINYGFIQLEVANEVSGIIAGTFEFTAADSRGNLVKVTEGRFDINHKTL